MDTPGLEVTVRGQYYCNVERGKALKMYKNEIFHLPETMVIRTGYEKFYQMIEGRKVKRVRPKKEKVSTRVWLQHIIMRLCVPSRLKEKYEDYAGLRTCVIENVKRVSAMPESSVGTLDPKDIKTMSLSELQRFITTEGISVPLEDYVDIDDARQAVSDEFDNVRKQEDANLAKQTTEKLDERSNPDDLGKDPDKTTEGADGIKEDHYTDPSLKPLPVGAEKPADELLD